MSPCPLWPCGPARNSDSFALSAARPIKVASVILRDLSPLVHVVWLRAILDRGKLCSGTPCAVLSNKSHLQTLQVPLFAGTPRHCLCPWICLASDGHHPFGRPRGFLTVFVYASLWPWSSGWSPDNGSAVPQPVVTGRLPEHWLMFTR